MRESFSGGGESGPAPVGGQTDGFALGVPYDGSKREWPGDPAFDEALAASRARVRARFEAWRLGKPQLGDGLAVPPVPPSTKPSGASTSSSPVIEDLLWRPVTCYAQIWSDISRTDPSDLPLLSRQFVALDQAAAGIEGIRPGLSRAVDTCLRRFPSWARDIRCAQSAASLCHAAEDEMEGIVRDFGSAPVPAQAVSERPASSPAAPDEPLPWASRRAVPTEVAAQPSVARRCLPFFLTALFACGIAVAWDEHRLRDSLVMRPPVVVVDYGPITGALGAGIPPSDLSAAFAAYKARAAKFRDLGYLVVNKVAVEAIPDGFVIPVPDFVPLGPTAPAPPALPQPTSSPHPVSLTVEPSRTPIPNGVGPASRSLPAADQLTLVAPGSNAPDMKPDEAAALLRALLRTR